MNADERELLAAVMAERATSEGMGDLPVWWFQSFAGALAESVDQIADARVTAALEAAAVAITAKCIGDPFAKPCKSCRDAAEVVRAAIPPPI